MVKRNGLYYLIVFLLPAFGWSTQDLPWLGNFAELEWRNSMRYQTYHHLLHGKKALPYASDDQFIDSSLSTAIFEYGIELELVCAHTRKQRGIDQFKITGRYVWMDDIAGDPLSLTSGFSFIESFEPSLHDPSSFHHGRGEGELFLSLGKEFNPGYNDDELDILGEWHARGWGVLAIGTSPTRGVPWARFIVAYDKRIGLRHEFRLFSKGLYGFGDRNLHLDDFHGYGLIRHRSVEVGFRYTYLIEFFGSASIEYANRVYAYNFAANASQVTVEVLYTFGP